MKNIKKIIGFCLILTTFFSCSLNDNLEDNTDINGAEIVTQDKIFDISTDNSGLVRITPISEGGMSYEVQYGHGTGVGASAIVNPGASTTHIYPEGNYTVTIISTDITGNSTTNTYPLSVVYVAPTNVVVIQNFAGTVLTVTATATNANGFTVNWGDASSTQTMSGSLGGTFTAPTHNYAPGVYTLTVTALSGGIATTTVTYPVTVNAPFGLPITYESPIQNYNIGGTFGGVDVAQVANPFPGGINTSATVRRYTKTNSAASWSGTWTPLSAPNGVPIDISNGSKIKVMVYSTEVGKLLNVEIEQGSGGVSNKVLKVASTVANQWEELVFDFGTFGIPAGTTFGQLVFRYNDAASGVGEVIYLDNITQSN
ncbi:hypothetical protein [Flavobacterium sp.]|jgi:hypothetical protein|uniref:hypothetical protein n=1 Tax=Flavobacterium sp. TaxID=239 RepID=UPI0037BF0329